MDDDIYVNLGVLVKMLAKFDETEPVYFGRAGTQFNKPRQAKSGENY